MYYRPPMDKIKVKSENTGSFFRAYHRQSEDRIRINRGKTGASFMRIRQSAAAPGEMRETRKVLFFQ